MRGSGVPNPGSFPQGTYLYVKCIVSAEQEGCHSGPFLCPLFSSDTYVSTEKDEVSHRLQAAPEKSGIG